MGTATRITDLLSQLIVHSLVASLFVEALVRTWRVREPGQRIALRLVALGYPLVLFPALVVLFPQRGAEEFQDVAILAGRRWEQVALGRSDLYHLFVWAFAAFGAAVFLMDVLPLVRSWRHPRPVTAPPDPQSAAALERALAAIPGPPLPVAFLPVDLPVLFCSGVLRPRVLISRGALRLLDEEELHAALAHETAHLRRRDPARSWLALGLRALMVPNPAFQVLARGIAREAERLADEEAGRLGADRLALASGLVKLHRATGGGLRVRRNLPFGSVMSGPLRRARSLDVERRARALLEPPARPLPFPTLRLLLAGAAVSGLLFFVV
jgi:Zn-dependent protease with chaperone function